MAYGGEIGQWSAYRLAMAVVAGGEPYGPTTHSPRAIESMLRGQIVYDLGPKLTPNRIKIMKIHDFSIRGPKRHPGASIGAAIGPKVGLG
jgi:hypothetical protein